MCANSLWWGGRQLGIGSGVTEDGTMYRAKSGKCVTTLRLLLCVLALLGFLAVSQSGLAQSSNGQITGLVTDSSGAAVEGANVSATNNATGVAYTTTSNGSGVYVLPQLVPGPYKSLVSQGRIRHRRAPRTDCSHRRSSFDRLQSEAGHHERNRDGHRISAADAVGPIQFLDGSR